MFRSTLLNKPLPRLIFCMLLLTTGCVLAFAPDTWLTMMARAFMWQWTLLFASLGLFVFFQRTRAIGLCAAACTLMSASQLDTVVPARATIDATADLRILHMNVLQPNDHFSRVIEQAIAVDADLIAVQEVDHRWAGALGAGFSAYPFRVIEPRSNCYGIALFSRMPLIDARVLELEGTPVIEASIAIGGEPVKFVTAHATSPISRHHFRKRNRQLMALSDRLETSTSTIVAGDLNSVQWDDAYKRFCVRSGLRPVTRPELRTWPAIGPIALIPIDHFFLSKDLSCTSVRRIELPGSDHFGLIADINVHHAK